MSTLSSIMTKGAMITLAGAALLGSAAVPPVQADDTEIFVATVPTTVSTRPNILFILDTSGSMDTEVVDREPYDPNVVYAGDCASDRVYWKTTSGSRPDCSSKRWVSRANFLCKLATDKLAEFGTWPITPAAQWDRDKRRWQALTSERDSYVECQADAPLKHGLSDGDGRYPADRERGPYTTSESQSITWTGAASGGYVFYSANYLNWLYYAPRTHLGTRLSIVQQAAKDTLERISNVNVGLMRFSSDGDGGMVMFPLSPVETTRDALKAAIEGLTANGWTPLSETFLEAYQYWTGGAVRFGLDSVVGSTLVPSVDSSRTGASLSLYRSPLGSACQKNFIIYLTDGDPTQDLAAEAQIEALPAFSTLGNLTSGPDNGGQCSENGALSTGDGKCLDDLAKYMFEKDFYDDPDLPPDRDPKENIRTYTIGFGNGVTPQGLALLQSTAQAGGGAFYEAGDTSSLTEVFNNIIRDVIKENVSFSAPAVSVNAFNRTQNLNDLFVTVFRPYDTYHWPGNLKKYRLNPNDGTIRDANDRPAVDESDGFFLDGSRSYWSGVTDGPQVELGGAASQLPDPTTGRNLYTDIAALSGAARALTDARNAVTATNTLIDAQMLGLPDTASAADRAALIEWARGQDPVGAAGAQRFEMGDPLHARPVSVIYGGTVAAPDAAVFMATNDGYLHAIDPDSGAELWAFIPSELLPRLASLRENALSSIKRFGLDGNLVAHRIDRDNDGLIESADGDKVYLFFGMGRGGDNYYALDVTKKSAPLLLWRNGASGTMTGLGQSWSSPVVTRVLVGKGSSQNAERLALVIGGGYDPTQDAVPYNPDDTGNALFILDALSGSVLWRASRSGADFNHASMDNSIPAEVRVLDMTNDGYADRLYAADTGARIWRFDIANGQDAASLVRGGVFASLGAAADGAGTSPVDARRFYAAPDISLLRADNRFYINIAIGSGYRGHPLNTEIHDAFYSLRDPRPFQPMSQSEYDALSVVTHEDPGLVDVTTQLTPTIPGGAKGWKIEFSQPAWAGEKVLAEARTFDGAILFPTFTPSGATVRQTCTAQSGTNALYIVRAVDGRPVLNRDSDATLELEDRAGRLDQHGIAPPVAVFFPTPDPGCSGSACKPPPVCLVGVEQCGISFSNAPVKTFWNSQDGEAGW